MNLHRASLQRRLLMTCAVLITALGAVAAKAADAPLKLNKGDHICYIGNTLGERFQFDGWLETLIQSRFAGYDLVFRNLCHSGDEVELDKRIRDDGFGSPDEWLSANAEPNKWDKEDRLRYVDTKADVIFAFFGFNESFAGEKGLDKFKKDFDGWIKHTQSMKYNGKSAPKIVVFSPIAMEKMPGGDIPDPTADNKNIKLYADAMKQITEANHETFVDLYDPSMKLYAAAKQPLTIDSMHLSHDGDKKIAHVIDESLFGAPPTRDEDQIEKLRKAIVDKDDYFYSHYQTPDGFNVYGGRSHVKYAEGQTNRVVALREMAVLDIMTSNRDKRVWALAQGHDMQVDDSNTPPFITVPTNDRGKGPNGTFIYDNAKDAMKAMTLGKGLKVNLFADEQRFPDLANPVAIAFDPQGRLWAAVWPDYTRWHAKTPHTDKLIVLEDTDHDGVADKCTTFADDLINPTGFEFYDGGVIVAQAPSMLYLKDTNGDGKADFRQRILEGIDTADTHHTCNSFVFDPGGAMYYQEGTFMRTQVETMDGPVRCANAGVYRYEPRTHKYSVYVTYPFANPHGHVFDYWGSDIVMDGTGAVPHLGWVFSSHLDYPQKHARNDPKLYKQHTRPCPGMWILSSPEFPKDMQGDLMVCNVIGFQGILRYKMTEKGAGMVGTEQEPIIKSSDPNFRPVSVKMGPDGAIYFADWQQALIGHLQHNIRDPNRDHTHGRIYRITYEGKTIEHPAKIAGEPVPHLLDLLKSHFEYVRYRAKTELGSRDKNEVIPALKTWIAGLDAKDPDYQHNLMEGLWVYQYMNVVNEPLLHKMLRSPDAHARAAATRVLCYWRDRISDPLALLKVQATDDDARVRLEAVRACSYFRTSKAAEVALESLNKPQDEYLKYVLDETMKQLGKFQ